MQSSLQCSIKCHQSAISWLVMKVYAITQLVLKIGKDSWFLLQEAKTATIPSGNHSWNSFLCQNYWYSSIFMSFLYSALWLGNLSEVYLQQCNKRFCTLSDPLTSQIYCLEFLSQEGAIFAVPGRWGQNNWVGLNWKSRLFLKKKVTCFGIDLGPVNFNRTFLFHAFLLRVIFIGRGSCSASCKHPFRSSMCHLSRLFHI